MALESPRPGRCLPGGREQERAGTAGWSTRLGRIPSLRAGLELRAELAYAAAQAWRRGVGRAEGPGTWECVAAGGVGGGGRPSASFSTADSARPRGSRVWPRCAHRDAGRAEPSRGAWVTEEEEGALPAPLGPGLAPRPRCCWKRISRATEIGPGPPLPPLSAPSAGLGVRDPPAPQPPTWAGRPRREKQQGRQRPTEGQREGMGAAHQGQGGKESGEISGGT